MTGGIHFHGDNTVHGDQTIVGGDLHRTAGGESDAVHILGILQAQLIQAIAQDLLPSSAGATVRAELESVKEGLTGGALDELEVKGRLARARELLALVGTVPDIVDGVTRVIDMFRH